MTGVPNGGQLVGVLPRLLHLLFKVIEATTDDSEESKARRSYLVECSFLEIYNEKLRNLLKKAVKKGGGGGGGGGSEELKVRESRELGVHVAGLTREAVHDEDEAKALLEQGTTNRTTASTLYNAESSRSHSVFEINVQCKCESTVLLCKPTIDAALS